MCCTSSAGLLGQVVTLSVNLTSDPGWATHQKPFRFHVASSSVVSSFLNSVWGCCGLRWDGCRTWVSVKANISQALRARVWSPCQWSGRKNPSVGLMKGNEIVEDWIWGGSCLAEKLIWFCGGTKSQRAGSRPLPSRLSHGEIPYSLLRLGGDEAVFPRSPSRQELCRNQASLQQWIILVLAWKGQTSACQDTSS